MAHPPAAKTNVMRGTGLPALRNGVKPPPASPAAAEKEAHAESQAAHDAQLEEIRAADPFSEAMAHAPYVEHLSPTQVWGVRAAAERSFTFGRWYFMAKDNAIVDTFMSQELYDAADVEARRALAHKFGARYAALGPNHSRLPHRDAALRKKYPSLVEQLRKV